MGSHVTARWDFRCKKLDDIGQRFSDFVSFVRFVQGSCNPNIIKIIYT